MLDCWRWAVTEKPKYVSSAEPLLFTIGTSVSRLKALEHQRQNDTIINAKQLKDMMKYETYNDYHWSILCMQKQNVSSVCNVRSLHGGTIEVLDIGLYSVLQKVRAATELSKIRIKLH